MDETNEEVNIIEASGGLEEAENEANNNFVKNVNSLSGGEADRERIEKRKKFFHQFIYQKNYQEALRSLLWEPYDCRDEPDIWIYKGFHENDECSNPPELPRPNSLSASDSMSLSSYSSYSSLEEILTVEMTQKSALGEENKYTLNIEVPRESKSRSWCLANAERNLKPTRTKDENSEPRRAEEEFLDGLSGSRCSADPIGNPKNSEIMVSDLEERCGEGVSTDDGHLGALMSHRAEMCASAIQYESSCCSGGACARDADTDVVNAVGEMLLTVEGTLEPRDSNEDTQLVSPDTSLDLNENPVRLSGPNRVEPGPSTGNVSVVNCYRAVPVSVVSTVPTIKCLNTQENVSNVRIIQTSSNGDQKSSMKYNSHSKRLPVRSSTGTGVVTTTAGINNASSMPSTSRIRNKVPKDVNRTQNRHSVGTDQNPTNRTGNVERERPKSMNACAGDTKSEQPVGQPSESASISTSNGVNPVLFNHNRSISIPVLGNATKAMPLRCGSQQNISSRLDALLGSNNAERTDSSESAPTGNVPVQTEAAPERDSGLRPENSPSKSSPRTFTSTEAQTDDVPLGINSQSVINREQRRRERRERRHQRRLHQSVLSSGSVWQPNVDMMHRDRRGLPDILNSHMPPPYSAVPMPAIPSMPPPMPVPPGSQTVPHLVDSPPGQPLPHHNGLRLLFPFPGGRRSQGQMFTHEEETPKSCCGVVVTQTVSIRWFIVMISFVGICCVIVGTVLGAMKASGREHLTVSLLMIGVGIVLVTVSVVAWRLTSQDAPSCRSMLGLGGADDSTNEPNQRFVPRVPPSYGRPHHPYAAMMYPEFQYRPPPPSYQASMQEYRLRLLLLERPNDTAAGLQAAMSPPPTYRSQAGSTLGLRAPTFCRSLPQSDYSHPPSYRSRTSSTRPTLDPNGDTLGSVNHSRNSSLLSHVSDQNGNVSQAVVNVISVVGNTVDLHRGDTDLQIDSIKLGVDEEVPIPPLRMLLNKGKRSPATSSEDTKSENVNLVTIVTVSDSNAAPNREHSVESDVLAHL